jgi:predicted RND superfamily exporter protein
VFVHRPAVTVALLIGVLGLAWLWAGPPTFNSSAWVLLQGDQRNLATYNELRDSLNGMEIVGAVLDDLDVFSEAGAAKLDAVTRAIAAVPGVENVTSLTTDDRPVREGMGITMRPYIPADSAAGEADWPTIRQRVMTHLIARNVLVADDGRAAMVLAISDRQLEEGADHAKLREDLRRALAPFPEVHLIAYSVVDGEVRQTVKADAMVFVPAAGALMIVILLLTFRRLKLVAAMLINHALVLAALPPLLEVYAALAGWVQGRDVVTGFDLYTNMLLPLTAAIHLALQVHVVSACLRAEGDDAATRIALGVSRVRRPTLIAALTTIVGLGALAFSGISPVARFAIVGSVMVAFTAAYTLGPGLALIRWGLPDGHAGSEPTNAAEAASTTPGPPHHFPRWAGPVALILVALLPGIGMIRTDVRAIEFLSPRSPTRHAAELIDRRFGGINLFLIEFTPGPDAAAQPEATPVNDPAFLRLIREKRQRIAQLPGVGAAYDYSQAFSMLNRVWHGDDPAHDRLPESRFMHAMIGGLLSSTTLPFIEKLRTPEGDAGFVLVRTASMPSRDYLALLERVMALARADLPPDVSVRPRTGLHTVLEQDRRLVYEQAGSTAMTLGFVLVMTLLIWRSLPLAVAVTVVSGLPVLAMLGLAGYSDTSINSITMMTASVVLGLAVDDAAHLVDAALRRRREGMPRRDAVHEALRAKRRPIVCTSAILGSMLGLFALSSFPPVQAFGVLACAALLASLAAVLVLLPWVMRWGRQSASDTALSAQS